MENGRFLTNRKICFQRFKFRIQVLKFIYILISPITYVIFYRHIDTAFIYENERSIGRAIKHWEHSNENNLRSDLFITTKLPPYGNRAGEVERYLKHIF